MRQAAWGILVIGVLGAGACGGGDGTVADTPAVTDEGRLDPGNPGDTGFADIDRTDLAPPPDAAVEDPGPGEDPGTVVDPGTAPDDASTDPGTPDDPGASDPGTPDPGASDPGPAYHPEGWSDPAVHGAALKVGQEDCRTCHGTTLSGKGNAPGCDDCHSEGWRTNCTFCHGGTDNATGAPPRDLSGATAAAELRYPAHTAHVSRTRHPAYDCKECHVKPAALLDPGHILDDTPGRSEVIFHDISDAAVRDAAAGRCATAYCHGNGQGDNGAIGDRDPAPDCGGCHGSKAVEASWGGMSGDHRKHLGEGLECGDCHGAVVTGGTTIQNPDLHVNGAVDRTLPGISMVLNTCNGSCHGKFHIGNGW
jgi:hypothetical protein